MTDQSPRLLLDAMLGELAKWLRLMGYDALFIPDTADLVIVRRARAENRVVLTQDYALSRHRAITSVYIESDALEEQIEQVQKEIGSPSEPIQPRCSVCNTILEPMKHEEAKSFVPPYVWRTNNTFSHCVTCHRVYWKGTHWEGIQSKMDDLQDESE